MRIPKYRTRKDRDSAYVEMDGRRIALPGRAGSPESQDAYRRLLNDYLRSKAKDAKPRPIRFTLGLTVAELAVAWLTHCKVYYASANTRGNEYTSCRYSVRPLLAIRGDCAVAEFRSDDLRAVRDAMITGGWATESAKQPIVPWSRSHANAQIGRIKRMFRWGVDAGMVSPDVSAIIAAVAPLRKGRTFAAESKPVTPVPDALVDATLPFLPAVVRAMVEVQRLTGVRSDNLCAIRPMDIDRAGQVWIYRPPAHKGEHRGDSLAVPLGPKCQAVLRPYLGRAADVPCFSPRDATNKAADGRRAPGIRYTTGTYRNAIRRACKKAGILHWFPHQLRHAVTAAAKRAHGLDGARAYLGHAAVTTTEIYESRDLDLACEIAREIG